MSLYYYMRVVRGPSAQSGRVRSDHDGSEDRREGDGHGEREDDEGAGCGKEKEKK